MANFGDIFPLFGTWLWQSEWAFEYELFAGEFAQFFEEVTGLDYDDGLERMVPGYLANLGTALIEDYLADHESDGIVADFRDAEGIATSDAGLSYLRAIRRSVRSVYEVLESVPDSHLLLRDLFRPGDPIRVREKSASKALFQWDLILTRVVSVKGVKQITAGTVPISRERLEFLNDVFRGEVRSGRREVPKAFRDLPDVRAGIANQAAVETGRYALAAWMLASRPGPSHRPTVVNMDDDEFEFVSVAYPIIGELASVQHALSEAPDFVAEADGAWGWVQSSKGQKYLHASIQLRGDRLLAECNSGKRAKRLTERLGQLLGRRIGKPLKMKTSLNQQMALPPEPEPSFVETLKRDEQEQVRAQLSLVVLEKYRQVLDGDVPMVHGVPRELVKTKAGRESVANWLKYLEVCQSRDIARQDFWVDFEELWKELGILKLRV